MKTLSVSEAQQILTDAVIAEQSHKNRFKIFSAWTKRKREDKANVITKNTVATSNFFARKEFERQMNEAGWTAKKDGFVNDAFKGFSISFDNSAFTIQKFGLTLQPGKRPIKDLKTALENLHTRPVKFAKDYQLKDGTPVSISDLAIGGAVIINNRPAKDGSYTLQDGTILNVAGGIITKITNASTTRPAAMQMIAIQNDCEEMSRKLSDLKRRMNIK